MKITFDPIADALNLVFRKGEVAETREIGPEIFLDVDAYGKPLSLEILGVSEKLDEKDKGKIALDFSAFQKTPTGSPHLSK